MAGDVITTGTRAADPARVDAPRGTDPVTDAEQAEAGAPDVPGDRTADDAAQAPASPEGPEAEPGEPQAPDAPEDPADDTAPPSKPQAASTGSTQARTSRARAAVAAVQGQAADVAASGVGVRRRLARLGAQRGNDAQPGARPADQDRARDAPQGRRAADRAGLRHGRLLAPGTEAAERRPVHHPSAGRGDHPGRARHEHRHHLCRAAARHGGRHPVHADRTARRVRRGHRRAGGRRHQAGQGQVRRVGRGGDRPQDGGRDVPRHPRAGHQARGPAAQHADAALPEAGEAGAQSPGRSWRSTPRSPTGSA